MGPDSDIVICALLHATAQFDGAPHAQVCARKGSTACAQLSPALGGTAAASW